MNKLTIILFLILVQVSCLNKEKPDCLRFRDGTFRINAGNGNHRFIITRDRENQTELDLETDTLSGSKVRWVSDCEYELIHVYKRPHFSDTTEKRAILPDSPVTPVLVKIVATGEDFYIFEGRKDGIDFVFSDTMWVQKK